MPSRTRSNGAPSGPGCPSNPPTCPPQVSPHNDTPSVITPQTAGRNPASPPNYPSNLSGQTATPLPLHPNGTPLSPAPQGGPMPPAQQNTGFAANIRTTEPQREFVELIRSYTSDIHLTGAILPHTLRSDIKPGFLFRRVLMINPILFRKLKDLPVSRGVQWDNTHSGSIFKDLAFNLYDTMRQHTPSSSFNPSFLQ